MAIEIPQRSSLVDDCRIMLRFALRQGMAVSPELMHDIAATEAVLSKAKLPSLSAIPGDFIRTALESSTSEPAGGSPADPPAVDSAPAPVDGTAPAGERTPAAQPMPAGAIEILLRVHAALSAAVAPATAVTLEHSEPLPGKRGLLGGMPALVKAAAYMAIGFAIGFVLTAAPVANVKLQEAKAQITFGTPHAPKPAPASSPSPKATPAPAGHVP